MTTLPPSLASIRDELDATTTRLHALVDTMDDSTWRARPGTDRWSAAECVEHLNMTSRAYLPILRDALRDGRARGLTQAGGSNRMDLMGWFLAKMLEPPVKRMRVTTSPARVAWPSTLSSSSPTRRRSGTSGGAPAVPVPTKCTPPPEARTSLRSSVPVARRSANSGGLAAPAAA